MYSHLRDRDVAGIGVAVEFAVTRHICLSRGILNNHQIQRDVIHYMLCGIDVKSTSNDAQRCHIRARKCNTLAGLKSTSKLCIFEDGSSDGIS